MRLPTADANSSRLLALVTSPVSPELSRAAIEPEILERQVPCLSVSSHYRTLAAF